MEKWKGKIQLLKNKQWLVTLKNYSSMTYGQKLNNSVKLLMLHFILQMPFQRPETRNADFRKENALKNGRHKEWIYLPSTVASRAIRMYMPFSAWRKYAALGSVSTSTLREKHKKETRISFIKTQVLH